jgi:hypothetical protein
MPFRSLAHLDVKASRRGEIKHEYPARLLTVLNIFDRSPHCATL